MVLILQWLVLTFYFENCLAVINTLNDTEHDQLPPLFALDNYERCLVHGGTYCVVRAHLFANPQNELMTKIKEYSENTYKHFNYTYVDRGVCVDTTCRQFLEGNKTLKFTNLHTILEKCVNESMAKDYGMQAKISSVISCDNRNKDITVDWSDWIFLGIIFILLLTNIVGTIYDVITRNSSGTAKHGIGNAYLLSFSVIRNWKSMVTPRADDPRYSCLRALDGIKTIASIIVILAHSMIIVCNGFSDNPHYLEKIYNNTFALIFAKGSSFVHVFFVISGFLLVYNLETASENRALTWKQVPKILLKRWWRLTPTYALVLGFVTTWWRYLGSGPVWGFYITDRVVADCRKYWWQHLLYVNNYEPEDKFCAAPYWYLAADTQLYCLGMVVYFATRQRHRYRALAGLLVVSGVLTAMQIWMQDLDGTVNFSPETCRSVDNDTLMSMRICGHHNVASFVIGMASGYLGYQMQKKKIDLSNNKIMRYASWFFVPGLMLPMYWGSLLHVDGQRASLGARVVDASATILATALIVAFNIITIVTTSSGYLQKLCGWKGWLVPCKLSYAVFLTHMIIVWVLIGSKHQLIHVSIFYLIINFLGITAFSFLLAIPLYLMVEAPLSQLLKVDVGVSKSAQELKKTKKLK